MALVDNSVCGLCKRDKLPMGKRTKKKREALFACPHCDPHLALQIKKRQKAREEVERVQEDDGA